MNGKTFTRTQLINHEQGTMDLNGEDVALAIQVMDRDGDNVAHFGVNGHFLYSEFNPAYEVMQ